MSDVRRRVGGAATLLMAAGVLTVAAAAQRWWPACELGSFDSGACLRLQDHAYDYIAPREPWVPVGAAAELHAVGMVLLAMAVPLLPAVLTGRRPALLVTVAAWMVAGGVGAVAAVTWLSGRTGEVVTVPAVWIGGVLWLLALPALVVSLAATAEPAPGREEAGKWALVAFLLAGNPFGDLVLTPLLLGYTSYDTTPWAGAPSGLFLMGAGIAIGLTARRPAVNAATGHGLRSAPRRARGSRSAPGWRPRAS